jgi:hypothetical protein
VKGHTLLPPEPPVEAAAPLLDTLLELLQDWAPAFRQRRTWARAILLALGLLCGWGRRTLQLRPVLLGPAAPGLERPVQAL